MIKKGNYKTYPIFISYRRTDLSLEAEWLYNIIQTFFGKESVFFDQYEMEPGKRWDETLHTCVAEAHLILILIGPKWFSEQLESGRRKLDDPEDWVRQEIIAALTGYEDDKINKRIFSILINGASFSRDWLPLELRDLASFQRIKELNFDIKNYAEVAFNFYTTIHEEMTRLAESGLWLANIKPFDQNKVMNPYEFPEYQLPSALRYLRPKYPFKGLEFFKRDDARIFFGRKKEIGEIIDHFKKSQSIVRLYGQSGIGKSSLLFAGLLPRLESNNWEVDYYRISSTVPLYENLNIIIDNAKKSSSDNYLIILDQIEEIFIKPNVESGVDLDFLITRIKEIASFNVNGLHKCRVILSYRKEYDPEIKNALLSRGISSNEYWLKELNELSMREAIIGITKDQDLNDEYHISIEKGLDDLIISDLFSKEDKENPTPLLQVLLRKMWNNVSKNDIDNRKFTKLLYDESRNKNLQEFVLEQLQLISTKQPHFKQYVESGLALDILKCFCTDFDTSTDKKESEIIGRYSEDLSITKSLLQLFVDVYLLVRNEKSCRLPHDSLAKAINIQFTNSFLPGQRAFKLIESKGRDIEIGHPVEFSITDLAIIDAGKSGMRKLTAPEEIAIQQSREHQNEILNLEKTFEQRILQAKLEIQEQTMDNIARELHTNFSQLVSLININLAEIIPQSPATIKELIIETQSLARQLLSELKALSSSLNTDHIMYIGFANALDNELNRLIKTKNYQVTFTKVGQEYKLQPEQEIILFRMCQEILSNVVKHTKATSITVILNFESHLFTLILADNGKGFNINEALDESVQKQSTGLLNIKKRGKLINADIHIESEEGKGTRFIITIPKQKI